MKGSYSFFDFDGTLTTGDSFTGFIRHVLGFTGLLKVLLLSAPAILLWKSGLRDNTYAKLRIFRCAFRGMPLEKFEEAGRSYVGGIALMERREVVAELDRAVARGHSVAIVSASLGAWIRPWAARHGVTAVLATEPEVGPDLLLTGAFSRPNCQCAEKVRRILEQFPELKSDKSDLSVEAWGDSRGDAEMLALADYPHLLKH